MSKSLWRRTLLSLLAWEVGYLAIVWLIYHAAPWLQYYNFGDMLFLAGALELVFAFLGLSGAPPVLPNRPPLFMLGLTPTKAQEAADYRRELVESLLENNGSSLRLAASGLLTIFVSLGFTYLF